MTFGLELCRRYAEPLTLVASVILDDETAADEVVSDTIAAACRFVARAGPREVTLTKLARSLYHRCQGRLAVYERLGSARRHGGTDEPGSLRGSALRSLTVDERAVVALVLFGAHDLARTATTLNLPPAAVTGHLRDALARLVT